MKIAKPLIAGIVVIAAVLLSYVAFLLTTNYTSQTDLQHSLLEQYRMENSWRASSLSFFFNERRDDMVRLASSREIDVFFENRALGMSMEYGLKQSLPPIKKKFLSLINNRFGPDTAYLQIALLDEKGEILVHASAPGRPVSLPADTTELLGPAFREGVVIVRDDRRAILISAAHFFKNRYAGQIIAWINPVYITNHILSPQGTPLLAIRLVTDAGMPYAASGAALPSVPPIAGSDGLPARFRLERPAGMTEEMVGLRIAVKNTPFYLVAIAPTDDVLGKLDPGGLLVGMGVLALFVILAVIVIVRTITRSLVLKTSLEASLQHEQDVKRKNLQLEREVSERKLAEEALRQREEQYRTLVETSPDVIYTISFEDKTFRSVNTTFETVTGWLREEWIGRSFLDIVHPDDRQLALVLHRKAESAEGVFRSELRWLTRSGEYRLMEVTSTTLGSNGDAIGRLGIARDVTERSTLEEQLRQAVKMQAVGQLAGGIAHDFNNILSIIINASDLLLMDIGQDSPNRAHAEMVLSAAERGARLTQNLLTFSRKQILSLRPGDLNDIIRAVEPLITRLIREDLAFTTALTPDALPCLVDTIQIEQVLMNLAANASDAMPRGGLLTVSTGRLTMDDEFRRTHGFGQDGDYAVLRVEDTGIGMDVRTRERVFEPFFTTKDVGKGTGLGLAMVFGTVKQHRGYVEVRSELGKGTSFIIYLPLITHATGKAMLPEGGERPNGGTETILVAEDDDNLRTMLNRVLCGAGYQVIEARDGEDAVEVFRTHRERVSLLLFDVIMPRKNGKQAYDAIKGLRSDVKCLFLSGYTADIINRAGIAENEGAFLQKPVSPATLLKKVRDILDVRGPL